MYNKQILPLLSASVHNLILRKSLYDRAQSDADRAEIASIWMRDDADELINRLKELIEDE